MSSEALEIVKGWFGENSGVLITATASIAVAVISLAGVIIPKVLNRTINLDRYVSEYETVQRLSEIGVIKEEDVGKIRETLRKRVVRKYKTLGDYISILAELILMALLGAFIGLDLTNNEDEISKYVWLTFLVAALIVLFICLVSIVILIPRALLQGVRMLMEQKEGGLKVQDKEGAKGTEMLKRRIDQCNSSRLEEQR